MTRAIRLAAITAVLYFTPTVAVADDFTFEVPIRIENARDLVAVRVECVVSRAAMDSGVPAFSPENTVGRGQTRVPISLTGGSYTGSVEVVVNAAGLASAAEARSYGCSMAGYMPVTATWDGIMESGSFRERYESATGQTLQRLTTSVRANLP